MACSCHWMNEQQETPVKEEPRKYDAKNASSPSVLPTQPVFFLVVVVLSLKVYGPDPTVIITNMDLPPTVTVSSLKQP